MYTGYWGKQEKDTEQLRAFKKQGFKAATNNHLEYSSI